MMRKCKKLLGVASAGVMQMSTWGFFEWTNSLSDHFNFVHKSEATVCKMTSFLAEAETPKAFDAPRYPSAAA